MGENLPIGGLARATGVKVATIRYYEGIGLIGAPPRTASNRRVYGADAVRRLRFIRHARELGFDLPAIRQLLDLAGEPQRSCAEVDGIAQDHLDDIDSRISRLRALRGEVRRMLASCARGRVAECRILEVLRDHGFCRGHRH